MNEEKHADYRWCLAQSYDGYLRMKLHLFGNTQRDSSNAHLFDAFEERYDQIWLQSGTSRAEVEAAYAAEGAL